MAIELLFCGVLLLGFDSMIRTSTDLIKENDFTLKNARSR